MRSAFFFMLALIPCLLISSTDRVVTDPKPQRVLVLALDGVPKSLMDSVRAEGHFSNFKNVGAMIAPFPSVSNYSWSLIWGLPAVDGYQGKFYHRQLGKVVGSKEDETRMPTHPETYDVANYSLWDHYMSYLKGLSYLESDLKDVALQVLGSPQPRTVFIYSTAFDAIAHTEGEKELRAALHYLDLYLKWIAARHLEIYGETLEFALVSDHGSRMSAGPRVMGVEDLVEQTGFRWSSKLKKSRTVAAGHLGVLSGAAFTTHEVDRESFARALAQHEFIDVVATRTLFGVYEVLGKEGQMSFREYNGGIQIERVTGKDPLCLTTDGGLSIGTPYSSADVLSATLRTLYPDAPRRIAVGLTTGVKNPASVIASTKPGYELSSSGMGFFTKFTGRAGTHGGLLASDTLGIVMSTQRTTPDFVRAEDVSGVLGFSQMKQMFAPVSLFYDRGLEKQTLRVSCRLLNLQGTRQLQLKVSPWDPVHRTYDGDFERVRVPISPCAQESFRDFEIPLNVNSDLPHRLTGQVLDDKSRLVAELDTQFLFYKPFPSFQSFSFASFEKGLRKLLISQGGYIPYSLLPGDLEKRALQGYPSVKPFIEEAKNGNSDSSAADAESSEYEIRSRSYDFE